ncbi:transcriptional regulator [Methylocystis bryophila]|nr:transcriptional regulator [Methylocystis bryophila]
MGATLASTLKKGTIMTQMSDGAVKQLIEERLGQGLEPTRLLVTDDSGRHAGHAGHRPGAETHFRVEIVSSAFSGKSRLERHRLVNDLLKDAFAAGMHALELKAKAPDEAH